MAYLGTFNIDDYVGIPAATHRFSSGAAYAATSLTYSIYEEATTTGLDEDVDMTPASPFDSVTGCYWVRRQLTAAAGFEVGKNYMVLVKATVDSVAAIEMHTFQIGAKVDAIAVGGGTTAAANLKTAGDNYSATRGLTGTAVPAAAAGAAGGIPVSAAGSLAMDTLADWVNGGRLDLLLDAVLARLIDEAITTGVIVADGGNTSSSFQTDLAGGDDYWTHALILITSGALAGQVKEIGDFADTGGIVTLKSGQAFTGVPAGDVTFSIVNR